MNELPHANSLEEIPRQVNAQKLFGNFFRPASIRPTRAIADRRPLADDAGSREFRPNARKSMLVFGLVGTVLAGFAMNGPSSPLHGAARWYVPLAVGLLWVAMVSVFMWLAIPRVVLLLDRQGIQINDTFIAWNRIRETAILRVRHGRSSRRHLVLWMNDGRYLLTDLSGFFRFRIGGFSSELAGWIEYYKKAEGNLSFQSGR
ncbi:hypothetical protein [Flaviaesturariibacter terrae]